MRLKYPLAAVTAAGLALVVTACGGGGGTASSPGATAPANPPSAPAALSPPSITAQPPGGVEVAPGQSHTWVVTAAGDGQLAYQWLRAGMPIPGATSSSYTGTNLGVGDDGVDIAVRVSSAGGSVTSAASRVRVTPTGPVRSISACGSITEPGLYRLTADISGRVGAACVTVTNARDVVLDCDGHTVSNPSADYWAAAVRISGSTGVSLRGCKMSSDSTQILKSADMSIGDADFTVYGSPSIQHQIIMKEVQNLHFARNKVRGYLNAVYVDGARIIANTMTASPIQSIGSLVGLVYGADNAIISNVLDGGWSGDLAKPIGADDGVVLQDQVGAAVIDNTVRNTWDAGIEWVGVLARSEIARNTIDNVAFAAIGGWHWSSVSDSRFLGNRASRTQAMFLLGYMHCLRSAGIDEERRQPADDAVKVKDNVFESNKLIDRRSPYGEAAVTGNVGFNPSMTQSDCGYPPDQRVPTKADFQLSNNVFRNNDFGALSPSLMLTPEFAASIVDGGGNVCVQAVGSPIQCKPPTP